MTKLYDSGMHAHVNLSLLLLQKVQCCFCLADNCKMLQFAAAAAADDDDDDSAAVVAAAAAAAMMNDDGGGDDDDDNADAADE